MTVRKISSESQMDFVEVRRLHRGKKKFKLLAPYIPLNWQLGPLRDKSQVLLLTGSAGGGKSRIASEKIHAFCKKYPNSTCIGLRKAREYATRSVSFAIRKAIGADPHVKYNASLMAFEYSNGSRIFIAGMKNEEQRQALRSIGGDGSVDFIWGEEANALTEEDHNELLARLRGTAAPWRQILYTTNPDSAYHWINLRLIQDGEASVYFSRAEDNPYNPPEYLETLNSLTGVQHKRLALGQWVQAEGVVYEGYYEEMHLVDPFRIPDDWYKFKAVDFGYTNPFVCQWWAVDNDDRMYLYREIYHTARTIDAHIDQILLLSGDSGRRHLAVCDHDAGGRAMLEAKGIPTMPADKRISEGIQKVEGRLTPAGDGLPRLYLFKNAAVERDPSLESDRKPTSTAMEISGYRWPKGVDGKPVKEQPVKENDHGMDALRYAVMHMDGGARYVDVAVAE